MLPRRTSHVVSHKRYWEGSHKFGALAHMVLLPSNCLQLCFDTFTTTIFLYGHCNVIYKCPLRYFNTGKKAKNNKYQMKHKVDWPEQRSHSTISPLHFMAMVGWTANHLYWLCTLWLRPKEICFVIKIEIYKSRITRMAGSSFSTFDTSSCPFHSQNNVGLLDSWHSTLLATCNQCNRRKQKQTLVHRCDSKKKNHTLSSQKSLASVLPIFLHNP